MVRFLKYPENVLNEWQVIFGRSPDYPRWWKSIFIFGVVKFLRSPNLGCTIDRKYYKGFVFVFRMPTISVDFRNIIRRW